LIFAYIWYLIAAPAEKKRFLKSGYTECHPNYDFHVTHTSGYLLFQKLHERQLTFKCVTLTDTNSFYIVRKDEKRIFISCHEDELFHKHDLTGALQSMQNYAAEKYPDEPNEFYACLKDREYLSAEEKKIMKQDKRFIYLKDVAQII